MDERLSRDTHFITSFMPTSKNIKREEETTAMMSPRVYLKKRRDARGSIVFKTHEIIFYFITKGIKIKFPYIEDPHNEWRDSFKSLDERISFICHSSFVWLDCRFDESSS